MRPLLIRRPDRSAVDGHRVFAAYADPVRPWLESGTVDDLHDVLDLDLFGLRAGRTSGLARDESSIFCVCTHGKHDTCCAERGRPAAAALEAAHRDHTWEVSHIGGDRFAGNMLVLPHGLYYGRIDAVTALTSRVPTRPASSTSTTCAGGPGCRPPHSTPRSRSAATSPRPATTRSTSSRARSTGG